MIDRRVGLPSGSTVGDVTEIGDGTRADVKARSMWRRQRTWIELVVLLAAVVVMGVNAPFVFSPMVETGRLHREGVAVSGA
jgi:hypothetical protein